MNEASAILITRHKGYIWIKVEAQGSFKNSQPLKKCAQNLIRQGERNFVVDLENCPGMDSTFMGTLAGIALRLRDNGDGALHIIKASERNYKSLTNLGLDAILEIHEDPGQFDEKVNGSDTIDIPESQPSENARTILEAHESLIEAEPSNLTQFKDVIDFLREETNSKKEE